MDFNQSIHTKTLFPIQLQHRSCYIVSSKNMTQTPDPNQNDRLIKQICLCNIMIAVLYFCGCLFLELNLQTCAVDLIPFKFGLTLA